MRIHVYLKNNRAKFHFDPILNNEALGLCKACPPTKKEEQGEYRYEISSWSKS